MANATPRNVITFQAAQAGRLDALLTAWLAANPLPDRVFSRVVIAETIKAGRVQVNGRLVKKPSTKLETGDTVTLDVPAQRPMVLEPEDLAFDVMHMDDDVVVINKPVGLRVHPTTEDLTGSLVAGMLGRGISLAPAGGELRPGVVHRLDKTTSGVMVLARSDVAYYALVEQFKARTVQKHYRAWTLSHLPAREGVIEAPIARHAAQRKLFAVVPYGKPSTTEYRVLERTPVGDLADITLHTGRTHQIRVHFQYLRASVLGDKVYGGALTTAAILKVSREADGHGGSVGESRRVLEQIAGILRDYPGNCLHAQSLGFTHPTRGTFLDFTAPLPRELQRIGELLLGHNTGE